MSFFRPVYAISTIVSCLVLLSASAVASTGIAVVGPEESDLWQVVERFGVPLGLLAAVFWVMVRAGKFMAPHVVAWIGSQVEQSRVVCEAVPKMEQALGRAAEGVEDIPRKLARIEESVAETDKKVAELLSRKAL
jgi:hypothetical protein